MHSNQHFLEFAPGILKQGEEKWVILAWKGLVYLRCCVPETIWLLAEINIEFIDCLNSSQLNKVRVGEDECFIARRVSGEIVAF